MELSPRRSQAICLALAVSSILVCVAAPGSWKHGTSTTQPPADAPLPAGDDEVRKVATFASLPSLVAAGAAAPATQHPARRPVAVAHLPDLAGRDEPVGARVVVSHLDAGTPPVEIAAAVAHGDLRFSGFASGPSRMFVDVPGFAPVTIDRAELGPHVTSLGPLGLSEGRALRVEIEGSRTAPARVVVKAKSSSQPVYVRRVTISKGEDMTLRGLGPGRFDVCVQVLGSELRIVTGTIDVSDADAALSID